MARYHIVCSIKEANPCSNNGYVHIAKVGYPAATGQVAVVSRATMIARLDSGDTAYTTGGGETAEVRAYDCDKCESRFMRTVQDETKADNLHALPACTS